jgi:mono/diheme cytochrome c family protein
MRRLRKFICYFAAPIVVMIGCARFPGMQWDGDGVDDEALRQQFKMPAEQKAQLSFSFIQQNIIIPKCISCHGSAGNVNLESYQNLIGNLAKIKMAVFVKHTMPKDRSITRGELAALWNWIELGGPENSQNGQVEPELPPLAPTYDSIRKNIFQVRCFTCHSKGHPAERVSLNKENLLNSPLELAIPGNPDESGLVLALERLDKKRMPPEKEGYSRLKEDSLKIIRQWIANGAKD